MPWKTIITETFARSFKKFRKNQEFRQALDQKLRRLQEAPENVGGFLAGRLHGYKSTRLLGKYRLLFKIEPVVHAVFLMAIDHRKFDYENFEGD